jgi:hypothetical protein
VNDKFNIDRAVSKWTNRRFGMDSHAYTGRDPSEGDLNSVILEQIYQGLKAEVGQREAGNFAKFVANLTDLSASAFIQAFQRFWWSGCRETNIVQPEGSAWDLTGGGTDEAIALLGAFMHGRMPRQEVLQTSQRIKAKFVADHAAEIARK